MTRPYARKLKIRDPIELYKKYQDMLHEAFFKQNVYYRMNEIHGRTTDPLLRQLEKRYENLVTTCDKLATLSKKTCRKLYYEEIRWPLI